MNEETIIEVKDLETVIDGNLVHCALNLGVRRGEVLALIGGSGSGKTTLLRALLGLQQASAGAIVLFGNELQHCQPAALAELQHRWGVLFRRGALFSALTVFDNIALPLRELHSVPDDIVTTLVMLKLAQVGLQPADAAKMSAELSGGMVKRVSLARALILDPQLLFLDEPASGLDPESSKQFVRLVRNLRRELGLTVVMVTHDVDTVFALADRVSVLAEHTIFAVGPLAEVARMPHPFGRSFFLGHDSRCVEDGIRSDRQSLEEVGDGGEAPGLCQDRVAT